MTGYKFSFLTAAHNSDLWQHYCNGEKLKQGKTLPNLFTRKRVRRKLTEQKRMDNYRGETLEARFKDTAQQLS